jgi:hypothetical protein
LLLAKYQMLDGSSLADAVRRVADQLRAIGAIQVRAFTAQDGSGTTIWLTAAFSRPIRVPELEKAAGSCGSVGASLFNLYTPYHRA